MILTNNPLAEKQLLRDLWCGNPPEAEVLL